VFYIQLPQIAEFFGNFGAICDNSMFLSDIWIFYPIEHRTV
jgi:hypothetical protein